MTRALWQADTVRWFRRALRESPFADVALDTLAPLLAPTDTVLDVGCGPGTLSIPLARRVAHVTALDPSEAMLQGLADEMDVAGVTNVTPLHGDWQTLCAGLEPHDVVLVANAPGVIRDLDQFLPAAHRLARRWVVLILGAGAKRNKFFGRELRARLGLPPPKSRTDYLENYAALHARGIYAHVRILDYAFDQPFDDWADAVAFYRAHLGLETTEHDDTIEAFLRDRLVVMPAGPREPMPKRSAVIWWKPPPAE